MNVNMLQWIVLLRLALSNTTETQHGCKAPNENNYKGWRYIGMPIKPIRQYT